MFYSVDVWMKAMGTFVIAVLTFVILAVLAWRNGAYILQYNMSGRNSIGILFTFFFAETGNRYE